MVDTNKIAIADVLYHPNFGLVSHQPIFGKKIEDKIRVRDKSRCVIFVFASKCRRATVEERDRYWKIFDESSEKE